MKKLWHYLRFDWPLHFMLLFTNWLPDNVFFLRVRGALIRPLLVNAAVILESGEMFNFTIRN